MALRSRCSTKLPAFMRKPSHLLCLGTLGLLLIGAIGVRSRMDTHLQTVATPIRESVEAPADVVLKDEAALTQLRQSGQHESLGNALDAARHQIEKIEPNHPNSHGADYFAANPRNRLRAWFHQDGIELAGAGTLVAPTGVKQDALGAWSLNMRVKSAGRGQVVQPVQLGAVQADGRRIEMTAPNGDMTQWFENRQEGIEQGFTIHHRPAGDGPLQVVMTVESSLHARAVADAQGVTSALHFDRSDGREVLHYRDLKAWDATGQALAARMELRGQEVALMVADTGAQYPVTIDPLFVNVEARLTADLGTGDQFGQSVALSGDTALVSAPYDDTHFGTNAGCVYVFIRNGTKWRHQTQLLPSNGAADEAFGTALSLSGDTAVVGSSSKDTAAGADAGSVHVFVRTSDVWSEQAILTASDGAAGDLFGTSVAMSGQTVLVGAPLEGLSPGVNTGSAYVFVRSGTSWSQEAKLVASDGAVDDKFGTSVALSGNTALVGAPFDDLPRGSDAGSSYMFLRSGTSWSQQAKVIAADGETFDQFGSAVALDVNTALVGVPFSNNGRTDNSRPGSAYVFFRSGVNWTQQAKLVTSNGTYSGSSVSLSGDTAILGAPNGTGQVFVFVRSGVTWSQQANLTVSGGANFDAYGRSVAFSGNTILAGAPGDDTATGIDVGMAQVHVYTTSWQTQVQLIAQNSPLDDELGASVALNGDTALVGAPSDESLIAETGCVYVFVRAGGVWRLQARLHISEFDDQARNKKFGASVAIEGNTAVVGAPQGFQTGNLTGNAYVFVRSGAIWNQQAKLTASDAADGDAFGQSVALSGDTALIGAPYDENTTGSAYVFVRSGSTWSQQTKLAVSGSPQGTFGWAVALEGDTALIGTPYQNGGSGSPKVFVYVRSGTSWSQQAAMLCPDGDNFNFGFSVALGGNTALIGTPRETRNATPIPGSVYAFVRSGTAWSQQAKLTPNDGAGYDQFGYSVALDGNTALVGARWDDSSFGNESGSAYVFTRSGTLWSQQVKITSGVDASTSDEFGSAVALEGGALLVGAPKDDTNGTDSGSAYVFLVGEFPAVITPPVSRTVVPGQAVTFSVTASGYGTLQYQWRKNGTDIAGATGTSYSISSVTLADAGLYDVVISNAGGVATSAPATLTVNALSQFAQLFPNAPDASEGFLIVNLAPSGILHGWRFVGEQQWRTSGAAVGGLTSGNRAIEFRPVPGYIHPPQETVEIVSGEAATVLSLDYYETTTAGSGGISVTLKPNSITTGTGRAQWRLLGEDDNQWHDSGTTISNLIAGSYLIECKPVTGRATPTNANVTVSDGQTAVPTLTYFLPDATTGTLPSVLAYETVSGDNTKPYAYVGQIRSNVGSSTGFVVKPRVVATAAHVVWDDGTLSTTQGLQWLFQRHRGTHEPEPILPRGFYLFDGYAAQRVIDNSPGDSSPQAQTLDVAAMYFNEDAGRGGYGGFLASDQAANEFVLSSANKMLVGYPVDGIAATSQGRMHATSPANVVFNAAFGRTFTTAGIRSSGGNSGGPLCVQFEGGAYYPAAIYLGGNNQTVVRAIDSGVIELFNRAEVSGNGGGNNTGGGITHTSITTIPGTSAGALKVIIEPAAARTAGAGWRLAPESSYRVSSAQRNSLNPGSYVLQMMTVAGFDTPMVQNVAISAGQLSTVTYTYTVPLTPQELWRQENFGSAVNTGSGADLADPDGDGFTNTAEFAAGTNPNSTGDYFKANNPQRSGVSFIISTSGKAGRTYALERSASLAPGSWTTVATQGPLAYDAPVSLQDAASPVGAGFYRIRVSAP